MSTRTFATSKEWVQQHLKIGQCAPLIKKHLAAVLVGAGVAALLFLTVGWMQNDSKNHVDKRELDESPSSPNNQGGAVYTRWGRTTCPMPDTERVYLGYAAGNHYSHAGGGANILCLPDSPEWATKDDTLRSLGFIYGVEYEIADGASFPFDATNAAGGTKLQDHNMPCSVCESKVRTTALMIPAKKTCPDGWKVEYWGYLVGGHYLHKRSEYICVDRAPEGDDAGFRNENGALMYSVEGRCGSLPCPPYVDGWELTCVVCTK